MKTVWQPHRNRGEVELAMTPMIDVVFLLLIFFLATASFEKIEQSMPTGVADMPASAAKETGSLDDWLQEIQESNEDVIIRIIQSDAKSAPTYLMNEQPIDNVDVIVVRIAALAKLKSDQPIIIDPDDTVPMGTAMKVYDLAKGVGALEVFFAAKSI